MITAAEFVFAPGEREHAQQKRAQDPTGPNDATLTALMLGSEVQHRSWAFYHTMIADGVSEADARRRLRWYWNPVYD